ncbi:MAG: RnfABCDGE type electron transport complex subunit A [Bacillota bacterium]
MENMMLIFTAIFASNVILSQFLGICPFIGVSKKFDSALGMGFAVIFVMTIASAITFVVNKYLLVSFGLEYLETIAFILVIASLVQIVEMFIKKFSPSLYKALGVFLPLITTNCAVLGIAILNIDEGYNLLQSVLNGFASGVGFLVAICLLASLRERMRKTDTPKAFQGFPIALIASALMSMAFAAFSGMSF